MTSVLTDVAPYYTAFGRKVKHCFDLARREVRVTLHSLDLTAAYGKDYELLNDGVEYSGDGRSILERYATAPDTEVPSAGDTGGTFYADGTSGGGDGADEPGAQSAGGAEPDAAEAKELAQRFQEELIGASMRELEYSSQLTVTFCPMRRKRRSRFPWPGRARSVC